MENQKNWKVGELAKNTGLSVRTLHYYDQIGLLVPSRNKGNGHRLYTETDIVRLQQIVALKHLGFSLDEIKDFLLSADYAPGKVINLHISQLREHIKSQQNLCHRLERIAENLQAQKEVTADQFIAIIEAIKSSEKYPLARELNNNIKRDGELQDKVKSRQNGGEWSDLSYAMK